MSKSKKKQDKDKGNHRKKLFFKNRLPKSTPRRTQKHLLKIDNPRITSIKPGSNFIYDTNAFEIYFSQVSDKNNLKLKPRELLFLKNSIDQLKIQNEINPSKIINIPLDIFKKIETFTPKIEQKDEEVLYIKKLVESQKNLGYISCRRIASKYYNDTGKKISKTKVNNIMRNKLGLHFIKTTIKNQKINNNKNILISLCFIKILIKCLKLNFHLIFVDESIIQANNNNYKIWRKKNEEISYNLKGKQRKNLIAAIDFDSLLYYKINNENTDENQFLFFIKELKNIIDKKIIGDYVIIMDNLSAHKTDLLKKYYLEQKMNILFNSPYQSSFNLIELFFRLIKRKIYQNIFSSSEEASKEIERIIKDENLKNGLMKNYRETLEIYYYYSKKYEDLNLNNLEYE